MPEKRSRLHSSAFIFGSLCLCVFVVFFPLNRNFRAKTIFHRAIGGRARSGSRRPFPRGNSRGPPAGRATSRFRSAPVPNFVRCVVPGPHRGTFSGGPSGTIDVATSSRGRGNSRNGRGGNSWGNAFGAATPPALHQRIVMPGQFRLRFGPQPHARHGLASQPAAEPLHQRRKRSAWRDVDQSSPKVKQHRLPGRFQRCGERGCHVDAGHGRGDAQPLQLEPNQLEEMVRGGRGLKQPHRQRKI